MLRVRGVFAWVFAVFGAGCAHAPCAAGRACGAAVWSEPSGPDERIVVAAVTEVGVPSAPSGLRATVPVGARPTVLRFDLSGVPSSARVARAVLSLRPDPSWRPGATRLTVFAVRERWSAAQVARGREPALSDALGATVELPAVRAPVRVDVTDAVRGWAAGTRELEGLGLVADGAAVVFAGDARLEVALR